MVRMVNLTLSNFTAIKINFKKMNIDFEVAGFTPQRCFSQWGPGQQHQLPCDAARNADPQAPPEPADPEPGEGGVHVPVAQAPRAVCITEG